MMLSEEVRFSDYLVLMKPRVMSLVIFTAFVGMVLAPVAMHPIVAASALILIATGAGASAILNMWYEAELDAKMARTKMRPIPQGRVTREEALTLGLGLSALSVFSLGILVNWLSAALLLFTIFYYAVIYTMWLKPHTPQNIVIGGAAGAFPPLIGWAAASNGITLEPLVLFLIIFLWTPPHFWSLALIKSDDYKRANIPMLPVVAGVKTTLWHMLAYTLALFGASLLPYTLGMSGALYLQVALASGAVFIALVLTLFASKEKEKWAGRVFAYSIVYLFALFLALMLDRWSF